MESERWCNRRRDGDPWAELSDEAELLLVLGVNTAGSKRDQELEEREQIRGERMNRRCCLNRRSTAGAERREEHDSKGVVQPRATAAVLVSIRVVPSSEKEGLRYDGNCLLAPL